MQRRVRAWRIFLAGCGALCGALGGDLHAQDGIGQWAFNVQGFIQSSPALSADGAIIYVGVEGRNGRGRVFAISRDGTRAIWTSAELPGPINSSPAVDAETVYVGGGDGRLYAFNAATGAVRWQIREPSYITSSPALGANGVIYFGTGLGAGKLRAVRAATGADVWTFSPTGTTDSSAAIESSPAIAADGTIYIGSNDHFIYAVRPDGTERWRFQTGGVVYASPAIGRDGTVYVASSDQRIYALSPADGTRKWDLFTNGDIQSSPIVGPDDTIYVVSSDRQIYAIRADGTERWRTEYGVTTASTPAIRGDGMVIFGGDDNRVRAYDGNTGALRWTFTGTQGDQDFMESSPVVAPDGSIYIGSSDGNLYKIGGNGSPLSAFASWPAFRRDAQHTARMVSSAPGQLFNLSTRAQVAAGGTVVVGFFAQGASEKVYLLRGAGPALAQFGISTFMTNPRLDLYSGTQILIGNDNWDEAPTQSPFGVADAAKELGAFPFPAGSKDAALIVPLSPGLYSARISNVDARAGVALVEAYDARGGDLTARLMNVSTLGPVGATRENFLVAGVSVGGTDRTRLLVRGVGPSLTQFGVTGVLTRPVMSVYTGGESPRLLRTNSGWTSEGLKNDILVAARMVAAFALIDNSADAAMILSVDPGNYTVEISGVNATSGQALVELYVLP